MEFETLRKLKVGDRVVGRIKAFGQKPGLTPIFEVEPENSGLVTFSEGKEHYSWIHAWDIELYGQDDEVVSGITNNWESLMLDLAPHVNFGELPQVEKILEKYSRWMLNCGR